MSTDLLNQAKKLASLPYTVDIMRDETTDGQPIYVLSHPELPGCMAQGKTIEEAANSLEEARLEFILSLLEDGLPVPEPRTMVTTTASFASETVAIVGEYRGASDEPVERNRLSEVMPILTKNQKPLVPA